VLTLYIDECSRINSSRLSLKIRTGIPAGISLMLMFEYDTVPVDFVYFLNTIFAGFHRRFAVF
jgi:hypothetical protein